MDKKTIALVVVIILLLVGLSFAKTKAPGEVDWSHNFYNTKTSPYGTYITYELLEDVFDKKKIKSTRLPIYNNLKKGMGEYFVYDDLRNDSDDYSEYEDTYIEELSDEDKSIISQEKKDPTEWYNEIDDIADTTSYIFINTRFHIDKLDMEYMLDFVGIGNNVFISGEIFDRNLIDTLGIKSVNAYLKADTAFTLVDYPQKEYNFGRVYSKISLNMDSCQLPYRKLALNKNGEIVFVQIKYGKGNIYLHAIPSAFANVNMLQTEKYDFGFRSLSYLPHNSKILWDEYQKQGSPGEGGSFQEMMKSPPLKLALYIILGGFLLFMIFRAKRIQRVIPVINPPVNSSLEFLDTISNLYYQKKDFKTIAVKRHAYFLDFIRKHFYMSTENTDGEFINVLSGKSGVEKEKLNELFILYKDLYILPYVSNDVFLKYNSLLEEFYRNVKNK